MLDIIPYSMYEGAITKIKIFDDNFNEVIEISPIPFEIFNNDSTKKSISRYYLKKKTCENLIEQLEIANQEFEEAKQEFESVITTKPEPEPKKPPEIKPEPIIIEPEPEPEPEKPIIPEPISEVEPIETAPAPAPPSLEEITTSIIESEEFKALIENNQLSDMTIRSIVSKNTKPDLIDTLHEMVITHLKEKGIIEPTLFEKITKKVRGRPKKKTGE